MSNHSALPQKLPLAEIAEEIFLGFNPSRQPKISAQTASAPIIHVKDIVDGFLPPPSGLEQVEFSDSGSNGRFKLRKSDVLVSARGTLMKCAYITDSHLGAIPSTNFIVVRLKPVLRAELLWSFLRHPHTQAIMLARNSGSVQASLNIKDIQSIEISIPPPETQDDLVRLTELAELQYSAAIESARLRREESVDITGFYMGVSQ